MSCHRLRFVPARSSRHRVAALALYRALLRSAGKVPLPVSLNSESSRHPIRLAIKKAFAKNRAYTSLRLVYASLASGYKAISLLCQARTPSSAEHAQVIALLRSRSLKPSTAPRATEFTPLKPFLQRSITADGSPKYDTTYVLRHKQRKPNFCTTADGQPFIRLKKPQPDALSKMIGLKGLVFKNKVLRLVTVDQGLAHDAALEDQWDGLVSAQMKREGRVTSADSKEVTESFAWTAQLTRLWWEWKVETTWRDWLARGEALHRYMREQNPLRQTPADDDDRPTVPSSQKQHRVHPHTVVASSNRESAPFENAMKASLRTGRVTDPFAEPAWSALVQAKAKRMRQWVAKKAL